MKPPLRYTVPRDYQSPERPIQIVDETGKVVCTVPRDELRLAGEIVEAVNKKMPWGHRLFGPPHDQRQKEYDAWIGQRS